MRAASGVLLGDVEPPVMRTEVGYVPELAVRLSEQPSRAGERLADH